MPVITIDSDDEDDWPSPLPEAGPSVKRGVSATPAGDLHVSAERLRDQARLKRLQEEVASSQAEIADLEARTARQAASQTKRVKTDPADSPEDSQLKRVKREPGPARGWRKRAR